MNSTARLWKLGRLHGLVMASSTVLALAYPARAIQSTTLLWDACTDQQVVGYHLYYGTSSGSYNQSLDVGGATSATLSLDNGRAYFVVVTSYNSVGVESLPSQEVSFNTSPASNPVVNLANPGSTINGPATVTLSATASATNASIVQVDFYAGSTKLGSASQAPYNLTWNNAQPGSYNLSAVAYDSNGASALSPVVSVTIASFGVTGMQRDTSGNCQLTVTGAAGSTCDVYMSEDLANWRLMQTVTNTGGTMTISDPTAVQVSRRFYKLVSH